MRLPTLTTAICLAATPAPAHDWFADKYDPTTLLRCCDVPGEATGDRDCGPIEAGALTPENGGYRVRLSLDQARAVNPNATRPVDAFVALDRLQPSADPEGRAAICIKPSDRSGPLGGVECLFWWGGV